MEIRVWNETGDLIGFCEIKESEEAGFYKLDIYPGAIHEKTVPCRSKELGIYTARKLCEKWKAEAEEEFEKTHGEKPVGVMSETGFTIQEVGD